MLDASIHRCFFTRSLGFDGRAGSKHPPTGPFLMLDLAGLDVQQRIPSFFTQSGGLAQMVERSLSMREALGSIPRSSNIQDMAFILLSFSMENMLLKKRQKRALETNVLFILNIQITGYFLD